MEQNCHRVHGVPIIWAMVLLCAGCGGKKVKEKEAVPPVSSPSMTLAPRSMANSAQSVMLPSGPLFPAQTGHIASMKSVPGALSGDEPDVKAPGKVKLDVGYGPTPAELVKKMMVLGKVTKDDLLYDLGCGDGRIVIGAAKAAGCKGVGVDLDPFWVKKSRENAKEAGVSSLVTFEKGDLFTYDFTRATVVTIYLRQSLNIRLRPKLLKVLKPGTRLMSVNHTMGRWRPDGVAKHGIHRARLYIIPALMHGLWDFTILDGETRHRGSLHLRQQFQVLDGRLTLDGRKGTLREAKIRGREVVLRSPVVFLGKKQIATLKLVLAGETLSGELLFGTRRFPLAAKRSETPGRAKGY